MIWQGTRRALHLGLGPVEKADLPKSLHGPEWQLVRLRDRADIAHEIAGPLDDLSGLETGGYDLLVSAMVLQRTILPRIDALLAAYLRVLKPHTGIAVVVVPDLQRAAERLAEGRFAEPLFDGPAGPVTPLDIVYGMRAALKVDEARAAHRSGYSADLLMRLLAKAGFESFAAMRDRGACTIWAFGMRWAASETEKKAILANWQSR